MSAAKHTPGPWVVRPGVCRNDHPDTSADVHGSEGQFVADCGCHERANANAQLIASAPEQQAKIDALADALEAVLAWEEATRARLGLPQIDAPEWAHAARAALRAAGRLP